MFTCHTTAGTHLPVTRQHVHVYLSHDRMYMFVYLSHDTRLPVTQQQVHVCLSVTRYRYGIVGFNVPLDTI